MSKFFLIMFFPFIIFAVRRGHRSRISIYPQDRLNLTCTFLISAFQFAVHAHIFLALNFACCRGSCGIPSWVNRLAGIGNALRSAVGGAPTSTGPARAEGAGGPAAAGLVARTTDGDLTSEVDWKLSCTPGGAPGSAASS